MAFKMKNPSMAKMVKMAGNSRVATQMKAEEAMKMKKAMKMKEAMKMKKEPMEFNAKLRQASKEGKIEGKFKEIVDAAPKMKKGEAMKMKKGRPRQADDKVMKMKKPMKKTYREAYDGLSASAKAKYSGYSDFLKQAKAYNMKKYGTTEPTKAGFDITTGKKKSSGSSTSGGSTSGGSASADANKAVKDARKDKRQAGKDAKKEAMKDESGALIGGGKVKGAQAKKEARDEKQIPLNEAKQNKRKVRETNLKAFRDAKAKFKEDLAAWKQGGKEGPKPERPRRRDFMKA